MDLFAYTKAELWTSCLHAVVWTTLTQSLCQCNLICCRVLFNAFVDADEIKLGSKDKSWYQSVVGSLIYIAQKTWPDIATAASILGQFTSKPQLVHLMAVLQVVCYLKGTRTLGPCYSPKSDNQVTFFADADWAEDHLE